MEILPPLLGLAVLLGALAAAGAWSRLRRIRRRRGALREVIVPQRLGADALGARATLLQFSTETCATCPAVHRTLTALAADYEGVRHLDIDVTDRPDIARHFHVLQAPTTLVLDAQGCVQSRVGGVPSRRMLELELARLTADPAPV